MWRTGLWCDKMAQQLQRGCPWCSSLAGWWDLGLCQVLEKGTLEKTWSALKSFHPKYLKYPNGWIASTDKIDQGGVWWYQNYCTSNSSWKAKAEPMTDYGGWGVFHKEQSIQSTENWECSQSPWKCSLHTHWRWYLSSHREWALSAVMFRKESVTEVLGKAGCWKPS